MFDKIRAVRNPLTVVAIFAGLAEVSATLVLPRLEHDMQIVFIWFVMLFPVLLVVSFFVTLNWNPKVLYAPSDFEDEANFMTALGGVERKTANQVKAEEKETGT